MANISGYMPIANGTADSNRVYASVVSNNFAQIESAINSNALNSQNYSSSGLYGSHIQSSQVQSLHFGNGAVYSSHLPTSVIVESHMNYKSSDNGVRVARVGGVASNMPAYGVQAARYLVAATYASDAALQAASSDAVRHEVSVAFTNAFADSPAFTAAPYFLGEPIVSFGTAAQADTAIFGTNYAGPSKALVKGLASDSCKIEFVYEVSNTETYECAVYFALLGDKSSG